MKVFVHDAAKCCGCYQCQISCKDEHCSNDWTPYAKPQPLTGQFWGKLNEYVIGTVPKVRMYYISQRCNHCDNPSCIPACPVEAIYKRDDGLVIIDPAKCTGCKLCIDACQYESIYYNEGLNIAQKCTGCAHILDRGWPITEPRCVDACPNECLMFGEESGFSTQITQGEVLNPELGTEPRHYYLNIPKKFIGGTVYDPVTEEVVIGATCTLSGDKTATVTTDDFGDFWFEGLAAGSFSVKIESGGKVKTIDNISTEKDVNLGDIALS
ncbi:MAG: carboxypeptidase regulatory-like domain-containing protein [Dehalococcoidales bacterium]|nr:carboxypeptidase regulatory-like domain-containing protein [Dehalococcoidales bacterium]